MRTSNNFRNDEETEAERFGRKQPAIGKEEFSSGKGSDACAVSWSDPAQRRVSVRDDGLSSFPRMPGGERESVTCSPEDSISSWGPMENALLP